VAELIQGLLQRGPALGHRPAPSIRVSSSGPDNRYTLTARSPSGGIGSGPVDARRDRSGADAQQAAGWRWSCRCRARSLRRTSMAIRQGIQVINRPGEALAPAARGGGAGGRARAANPVTLHRARGT
jgi:hypothetical protein